MYLKCLKLINIDQFSNSLRLIGNSMGDAFFDRKYLILNAFRFLDNCLNLVLWILIAASFWTRIMVSGGSPSLTVDDITNESTRLWEDFLHYVDSLDFCSITLTQIGYGNASNFDIRTGDNSLILPMLYIVILQFGSSLFKGWII